MKKNWESKSYALMIPMTVWEVLASHMRKGGTIGIDKTWPARFLLRLMELQVGDAYSNASTIIDHIRQIKTEEEQQKMRVASQL